MSFSLSKNPFDKCSIYLFVCKKNMNDSRLENISLERILSDYVFLCYKKIGFRSTTIG